MLVHQPTHETYLEHLRKYLALLLRLNPGWKLEYETLILKRSDP